MRSSVLEEEHPVGANPVVVTFDDGTDDFADQAVPVLERYRIPVTLYVATHSSIEASPFPTARRPPRGPVCATLSPPGW